MMKSVDFETRECYRDGGIRLTWVTGVKIITHLDMETVADAGFSKGEGGQEIRKI